MKSFRLTLIAAALTASACSTTTAPIAQSEPSPPPVPPMEILAADQAEAIAGLKAQQEAKRNNVGAAVPPGLSPAPVPQAYTKMGTASGAAMATRAAPHVFMAMPERAALPPPNNTENYAHVAQSPVVLTAEQPVSTFSIDVDTGSYSNVRRLLNQGSLPPADAVRVEEFINYFRYDDAPATSTRTPFAVRTELAPNPWNANTRLLRVNIAGYAPTGPLPPSNLVFLVDVSGSMNAPDKLPLVKSSLKLLLGQLGERDRISLVTYAGSTRVVLEPTPATERATIEQAIDALDASGGTNGESGIQLAYQQAQKAFIKGGNNRVLLATDGDFNVGVTRFETLIDLVKEKRKSGVAMTTLGYGGSNYNDHLMEQVADAGDGNYSYIDTLQEAQKVLVAQRAGTLLTIARDVKIQVEFNPAVVAEYRLIGYENRALKREDFSNDAVDAGEIGAGHKVTALYEVAVRGEGGERNEPLRYGKEAAQPGKAGELAFVRVRYKRPEESKSQLIEQPVQLGEARKSLSDASPSLRLAAAAAAFGQKLKGGTYLGSFGYPQIAALAREARVGDAGDEAGGLVQLVGLAEGLSTAASRSSPPVAE